VTGCPTDQTTAAPDPGDAEAPFKEARRRETQRGIAGILVLVVLVATFGLGLNALLGGSAPLKTPKSAAPVRASLAGPGQRRYSVAAVILQAPGKKPELCPEVLTSLPPQ
jgi:hypothetical protein